MTYETIDFNIEDDIAFLLLNRPKAKNALDDVMRGEIADVIRRLKRGIDHKELDVRALVIGGQGGAFCGGGDVKGMAKKKTGLMMHSRVTDIQDWYRDLIKLEMPVIAAVDGPAFGAGFSIALAADFIIATPRSSFCAAFGRMGLVPDTSILFMLPRIVGLQRAKELIFSARVLDAEEARTLGIVYDIVADGEAIEAATELARKMKLASVAAVGLTKQLLNQTFESSQAAMAQAEALAQAIAIGTGYHVDAVERFVEKSALMFTGFSKRDWREPKL
ncbi:enoyl-CoA hydratase/isomerase family protein [Pseudomonas putida]